MFSVKQELEFNAAFIKEMIQSTSAEMDHWQEINAGYTNNVEKMVKYWNNPDWRPAHVVTMMAWTKKAIEYLQNRLQQTELKLKELDSERLPAEWATLRFQHGKILGQMNDIQVSKTRLLCHDLKNRLLGAQDDFDKPPNRAVFKNGSKVAKKSHGKVKLTFKNIDLTIKAHFRSRKWRPDRSIAKNWQNFCIKQLISVTEMDSKSTSTRTLVSTFVPVNLKMCMNTSKLKILRHQVTTSISSPKLKRNHQLMHHR